MIDVKKPLKSLIYDPYESQLELTIIGLSDRTKKRTKKDGRVQKTANNFSKNKCQCH